MIETQEILNCAQAFYRCHILVVGDLMLDEYLWGHIERISPEAPVPILKVIRTEATLGGAGNVVRNLRALGVTVTVCGVVGTDETGAEIRSLLEQFGIDTGGIIFDPNRKSSRKIRLMSLEHGQQVFRFDKETEHEVSGDIENQLVAHIEATAPRVQVILCSDYMKGVLTERVLGAVFSAVRENEIVSVVGPKNSNAQIYRGATILMPNQKELALLTRTTMNGNGWLMSSARQLIENLGLKALVVTRGSDGMSLFEVAPKDLISVDVPTMAKGVFDVTGAGDTAISVLASAVAAGASLKSSVHLANLAAGIKVAKRGTSTVTLSEIHQHLSDWEDGLVESANSDVTLQ